MALRCSFHVPFAPFFGLENGPGDDADLRFSAVGDVIC